MAKLSKNEVSHIAKLSRLELTPEEVSLYADQLSDVLDYVGQLSEIETEAVRPTASSAELANVYREDEVRESAISHDKIASNAPEFKDGNFVVPAVFE